jgi:hypothetical protein
MKIRIMKNVNIYWDCPSNSSINNTLVDVYDVPLFDISSAIVPQVDEKIILDGKKYVVTRIERLLKKFGNEYLDAEYHAFVKPENIFVPYYDYMKQYTHVCDNMKADDDPTRDLSKMNDEYEFPDTLEGWKENIANLK